MIDYQALADDITQRGLSGTTQEIANALNAVRVPGPIPYADLRQYLQLSGIWTKLLAATLNSDLPAALRAVAQTVLDVVSPNNFTAFNFHLPQTLARVMALLTPLLDARVLTQTDIDGMLALTAGRQSHCEATYGAPITELDVRKAGFVNEGTY